MLLSISGGSDSGLFEINEAAQLVADGRAPDANIIFGAVIDDALGDEVRVTVIAAGFDENQMGRTSRGPAASAPRPSPAPCARPGARVRPPAIPRTRPRGTREDTSGGTAGSGHAAPAAFTSAGQGDAGADLAALAAAEIPPGEEHVRRKRRPGRRGPGMTGPFRPAGPPAARRTAQRPGIRPGAP